MKKWNKHTKQLERWATSCRRNYAHGLASTNQGLHQHRDSKHRRRSRTITETCGAFSRARYSVRRGSSATE
jgi:hypothetical protein